MTIQNADLSRPDAKPANPAAPVSQTLPAAVRKQAAPSARPTYAWPFMVRSGNEAKAQ